MVEQDFWGQFHEQQEPPQEEIQEQAELLNDSTEDFNWENYESPSTFQGNPNPTSDESTISYLGRNLATNISRIAEQQAGKPGNLEKFSTDTLASLPQVGGLLGWGIAALIGKDNWEKMIRGPKFGGEDKQFFPTSEELKDLSQTLTQGYTKPRTKGEERFQEGIEDISAITSPTRLPSPRNFLVRNISIPAAANVGKNVVDFMGFGEDKANLAKYGIWTTLSLLDLVNAPRYASELMNRGRNGIPSNTPINVQSLEQELNQLESLPEMVASDPRTASARQQINSIREMLRNGRNDVRSLMTAYDGVNAVKRSKDLYELSRGDKRFARRALDRINNLLRTEISNSAQNYPEALQNWNDGLGAWASIHESNRIQNWISNLATGKYARVLTGPAAALFGGTIYGGMQNPAYALSGVGAAQAAYQTGKVAYRVMNNPTLADYYFRAISSAINENAPSFIKNYNKINKKLEKKEKSNNKKKKT